MILQLLLLIFTFVGIIWFIQTYKRLPQPKRKGFLLKYGFYLLTFIALFLVATGRMHWVAGALTAALAIGQRLLTLLLPLLPFMRRKSTQHSQQPPPTEHSKMSVAEALNILGLKDPTTVEAVNKRHKALMQKNHPDRGGSDFLAAQINQAKETLYNHLKAST